tara:strand:- start:4158 stop:5117 length:960 start_codon:yes stop_codon:yes gene_type:complete
MKEKKMGGKKHGMVLIISVGKKGDKDPMHAADPDSKKKMATHPFRDNRDAGRDEYHQTRYRMGETTDSNEPKQKDARLGDDVHGDVGVASMKEIHAKHGDPYAGMTQEQADEYNRLLAGHREFEEASQPEPEYPIQPLADDDPRSFMNAPVITRERHLYDQIFDEMKRKALKKASIDDLFQEASSLRDAGDKATARQFSDVASAMQRAPALRQSLIDRFGTQAINALAMTYPEMASTEGMGEMMFQEGKNNPDYIEARSDPSYLGEGRKPFMSAISALARGKQRVNTQELAAQEALQRLIAEDPSRFFADRRIMGEQGE